MKVAPSLLAADFTNLEKEINRVNDESLEKHNLNDHMTGIKVTRK